MKNKTLPLVVFVLLTANIFLGCVKVSRTDTQQDKLTASLENLVTSLQEEISAKDHLITSLEKELSAKDTLISLQYDLINVLEVKLSDYQ